MEGYRKRKRVMKEKDSLDLKLNSLTKFIASPSFDLICTREQKRLRRQEILMELYSEILDERICNYD